VNRSELESVDAGAEAPSAAPPVEASAASSHIERPLAWAEKRLGLVGASLLVGCALLGLAALYGMPATKCINHGCWYQAMATDPWHVDTSNPLRLRFLTPWVAYALGFRGKLYILFPVLLLALFLGGLYAYGRRRLGWRGSTALAFASAFATTTLIHSSLHFQGYQDATQYLLLLVAIAYGTSPVVAPLAVGLGVMSHESTLFHLPWVAQMMWRKKRGFLGFACASVVVGALIAATVFVRRALEAHGGSLYASNEYLSAEHVLYTLRDIARMFPIGVFMALRALWVVPLAAAWISLRRRDFSNLFFLAVIVGSAFLQLLIAWDTSRIVAMAFPAVIFGATTLTNAWGEALLARRLWLLVVANLLLPNYYIGGNNALPYLPVPVAYVVEHGLGIDVEKRWWGDCAYNKCNPS
jgi:hypothetical protein